MNTLILSNSIYSTFRFRRELIEEISKNNKLFIVANKDNNKNNFKVKNVNINYLYSKSNNLTLFKTLKDVLFLVKFINKYSIEVVYINSWHSILLFFLTNIFLKKKIKRNLKIFVNIAGLGNYFVNKKIKNNFIKFLFLLIVKKLPNFRTSIFFQNRQDYRYFRSKNVINFKNSHVIEGSGIDLNKFAYKNLKIDKIIRILFVGRSLKFKGIKELLNVASKITKDYSFVYFDFVLLKNKNNPDYYKFSQPNNNQINFYYNVIDIRSFYYRSSLFVLPSYREGCSRSILEALSIGRAVITTYHGGGSEVVINNYNGYLIPKKNEIILFNKIKYLIENQNKLITMGSNSRILAEKKFDVKKLNNKLINIFFINKDH